MKKTVLITFLLAFIISLLFLSSCSDTIVVSEDKAENLNTIAVQGNAVIEVSPDEAEVVLAVITENKDVKIAQNENTELSSKLIESLKSKGFENIETLSYDLHKITEWDPEKQKNIDKGYRVSNSVKVSSSEINKVGEIIDIAVAQGVKEISRLNFQLSKGKEESVKLLLLEEATRDARSKAVVISKSLNVKLGKAVSATEFNVQIYPKYYAYALETASSEFIEPRNVETSASVNVVFMIE